VRLPHEVKELFAAWLEAHVPLRARHILSLIRQSRGGRLNDPGFGTRMRGEGAHAELIGRRFAVAVQRLGLAREYPALRTDLFEPPSAGERQLRLL
jgi:DNA repair photolyase